MPLLTEVGRGKTQYHNIVSHDIANDNHNGREIPDYDGRRLNGSKRYDHRGTDGRNGC